MKYRIKEKTMVDGTKMYTPQKKFLFWYFDCTYIDHFGFNAAIDEETIEDAQAWIERQVEGANHETIKSIKIIK